MIPLDWTHIVERHIQQKAPATSTSPANWSNTSSTKAVPSKPARCPPSLFSPSHLCRHHAHSLIELPPKGTPCPNGTSIRPSPRTPTPNPSSTEKPLSQLLAAPVFPICGNRHCQQTSSQNCQVPYLACRYDFFHLLPTVLSTHIPPSTKDQQNS